jgi:hypothetical protein
MKYAQQTSPLSKLAVGCDAIMFNCRQRITKERERRKKLERTTLEQKG